MCGEHPPLALTSAACPGSSPRVRGTLSRQPRRCAGHRFIPACAGNTTAPAHRRRVRSVHPRVCGEHGEFAPVPVRPAGSSPRVRGTRVGPARAGHEFRFIPACAGNTPLRRYAARLDSVHPRVCGEHLEDFDDAFVQGGSSPRVRGTRRCDGRRRRRRRFIPACAGNTTPRSTEPDTRTVHPRVCGEHRYGSSRRPSTAGSSPRVRGTPLGVRVRDDAVRFIPACAGNTSGCASSCAGLPVHPRVCGEHMARYRYDKPNYGSSPRVRGTRVAAGSLLRPARFIPACAGNT